MFLFPLDEVKLLLSLNTLIPKLPNLLLLVCYKVSHHKLVYTGVHTHSFLICLTLVLTIQLVAVSNNSTQLTRIFGTISIIYSLSKELMIHIGVMSS